jgi:hypothetical protein
MCGNLRLSFATQTGTPAPQNQKAHYSIRRNGQDHRDCNIWKFIAFLKIGKEHKRPQDSEPMVFRKTWQRTLAPQVWETYVLLRRSGQGRRHCKAWFFVPIEEII